MPKTDAAAKAADDTRLPEDRVTPGPADGAPSDPLDHDHDGRKGGVAETPKVQHLVITADDEAHAVRRGEVVAVSDHYARKLLKADVARTATETEVELAQPRVRQWTPPA